MHPPGRQDLAVFQCSGDREGYERDVVITKKGKAMRKTSEDIKILEIVARGS